MTPAAPLVDTHAHVDDRRFAGDLTETLRRASEAGLVRVVAVATDAPSSRACLALAEKYSILAPTSGVHPNNLNDLIAGDWDAIERLAELPQVVAIGETGLDRYWKTVPFTLQEEYFARHLALSRRTGKPVVVHCREANDDVLRMLRDDFERHGPVRGVLHSFAGPWALGEAAVAMGMHLSFSGMVTRKASDELRAAAAATPAERVLVETDAPYLTPDPLRGKRNEPAFVVHTARAVASVRGEDFEQFARQSTANAAVLFGWSAGGLLASDRS